jgi:hypothetical protein
MALARREQSAQENIMFDSYIIEVSPPSSGLTFQAGIIVRDGRSFRFYAAARLFEPLEGQCFDGPRAAEKDALRRITDVATRKPKPAQTGQETWNRP